FPAIESIQNAFTSEDKDLVQGLQEAEGRVDFVILAEHENEEKVLKSKIPFPFQCEKGYLSAGFFLIDAQTAIIPYSEWSKKPKVRRNAWRVSQHSPTSEFHSLSPGDFVVHLHSGIAR